MVRLNIQEAKTQLSRHWKRLENGERILLCRWNAPTAEIRPLAKPRSSASCREIAVKRVPGRLTLPGQPDRLVPAQRQFHGIPALPIREEAALSVYRLPRLHADPFDRMLVCQAIVHGMAILTPDEQIRQHPARVIW